MHVSAHQRGGFSLVETLVGVAVLLIVAVSMYQAYAALMDATRSARIKVAATALANEQFEIIRNLDYSNVGIVDGLPSGPIPHLQTMTRDGYNFIVETIIRNIDDSFDGTIGGNPNDASPADYKLVEVGISCQNCDNFLPVSFTSWVAPQSLETASSNGALFVQVFDAVGQPISGASVHIENNAATSTFMIDDYTNNDGMLQIVDAPPGVGAYEITVSKSGYSTEQTYIVGDAANPNPSKPHVTVVMGELTQTSFSIDAVSTLDIDSVNQTCAAVPNIDFTLTGSKLIGTSPDVPKFNDSFSTDVAGNESVSDIEWDTYTLAVSNTTYDLAGTIPAFPLSLTPGSVQEVTLIMAPRDVRSVLIAVKDSGSQLPVSDAEVRLEGAGYDEIMTTDRGYMSQTDWSGGDGQEDFFDPTRFESSDGGISDNAVAGELSLQDSFGIYVPAGSLVSSTFDTGTTSNFHQLIWQSQSQPPAAGADSVRFQIATNNDNATWDFRGPDGTASSYFTLADQNIHPSQSGARYVRYKVMLATASTTWTPTISDVSFSYTSGCIPPGQVLFTGLGLGNYNVTVSKNGFTDAMETVSITDDWQQYDVMISE